MRQKPWTLLLCTLLAVVGPATRAGGVSHEQTGELRGAVPRAETGNRQDAPDREEHSLCAFGPYSDGFALKSILGRWAEESGLGGLKRWDAQISKQVAQVNLSTDRWSGVVLLRLGRSCQAPLDVTVLTREGTAPSQAALARIAQRFPAPRIVVGAPEQLELYEPFSPLALLGLALLLLAFALERSVRRRPWIRRSAVILLWIACGGLALWVIFPLFTAPFANDTPVLRIAYGRENPFGDWNHPFLPYLLNSPVLQFTLEPWAVRIVPFLWILAEVGVLVWVVVRWSGSLTAGALTGLWMVWELPRRPSIDELSDWDLAGAFLIGLLAFLGGMRQRPRAREAAPPAERGASPSTSAAPGAPLGRRELAILAALMTLGFFSSFMMVVPLGVLVLVLWWSPRRDLAMPVTACFAVLAFRASLVFLEGGQQTSGPNLPLELLIAQISTQFPHHRALAMAAVMAAGLLYLLAVVSGRLPRSPASGTTTARADGESDLGPGPPASLLLLGSVLAIPLATVVAWRLSHVNNGYYACLATPLWLLAGGAGCGWALTRINEDLAAWRPQRSLARWARRLAPLGLAVALLLLWQLTLSVPPRPNHQRHGLPSSAGHLSAFDDRQRREPLLILTNAIHLPLYIGLDRARRGQAVQGRLLPPGGPRDVLGRSLWMDARCQPWERQKSGRGKPWGWPELTGSFYVVTEHTGAAPLSCFERLPLRCTRLFPKRPWLNFHRCEPRSTAPLKSGPR